MEKYTRENIKKGLTDVGLRQGDLVFFQSRLYGLGIPEGTRGRDELCLFFLEGLLEVIGPDGTLVVPAYSTQVPRFDEPFIVEETVPNYGLFPEYVFKHDGFLRSLHPFLSVAATGKLKHEICRTGRVTNYGARSPFDIMARHNAKNIFLGIEPWEAISFGHYIEMHFGVPYVYNKLLKWRSIEKDTIRDGLSVAMVRHLSYDTNYDFKKFQEVLFSQGIFKTTEVGGGRIYAADVQSLIETGYDCLEKDPYFFLDSPPEFQYGDVPYDGPSFALESANRETESSPHAAAELKLERFSSLAPEFTGIAKVALKKLDSDPGVITAEHIKNRNGHFFTLAEDIASCIKTSPGAEHLSHNDIAALFVQFIEAYQNHTSSGAGAVTGAQITTIDTKLEPVMMMLARVLWAPMWRLYNFARSNFFAPFLLTSENYVELNAGNGWFSILAHQFGAGNICALHSTAAGARHGASIMEAQQIDNNSWAMEVVDDFRKLPFESAGVNTATIFSIHEFAEFTPCILQELHRILRPGGAAYVEGIAGITISNDGGLQSEVQDLRKAISDCGLMIECALEVDMKRGESESGTGFGAVVRK